MHNRIGINHDFLEELIEISNNTSKPVLYSWEEHSTIGYAIFEAGKRIKTISYNTHDIQYTVDGQNFKSNSIQVGSSKVYSSPEAKTIIPSEFHEYLNRERAAIEKLALKRGKIILYLRKDIIDISKFFEKSEENLNRQKRQSRRISFAFLLWLFLVLIVVFVAIFQKN